MKIYLGNTSVHEKHAPEAVGVDPATGDGLKTLLERLDAHGLTASLSENTPRSDGSVGPARLVTIKRPDLGSQITEISLPDSNWLPGFAPRMGHPHSERAPKPSEAVRLINELWPYHSDELPEWVECEDEAFAQAISDELGIPTHRPEGWAPKDIGTGAPATVERQPRSITELKDAEAAKWPENPGQDIKGPTALMVNGGRDALFRLLYDTSRTTLPGPFNFMGLTADSTTPTASMSSLTGEITTAGGGLIRAQATYAHTTGASTATLTHTFTANSSDSLPVVVARIGLFDASSGGNMGHTTLLNSTAPMNVSGDNVAVTETVTVTPS
jgi:hypothetical protein